MNREPITTSETIIAFLLREAEKDGIGDFTPLKIIKLVFLCHGCTLGIFNRPLIENRYGNIQAWKHGPVVIDAYQVLKRFRRSPVTLDEFCSSLTRVPFLNLKNRFIRELESFEENHLEEYALLGWVYNYYKNWSASHLVKLTHLEGTPWDDCYIEDRRDTPIPDALIESYYDNAIKRKEE